MAWFHGKNLKEILHKLESEKTLNQSNKTIV